MGAAFVKRRMQAELGPDWQARFGSFDLKPAAAASLGQVHRATTQDGAPLACKLQYPDMQSAVEADLSQLEIAFALHRRLDPAIDTREIAKEIGERVREELDYEREAKHAALYAHALRGIAEVRVPDVYPELSTRRLLTSRLARRREDPGLSPRRRPGDPQPARGRDVQGLVASLQPRRRDPRRSASRQLHGLLRRAASRAGINLLDYGCVRIFHPRFVGGVVDLYNGLLHDDRDRIVHAYETWGFKRLSAELIDILNIWARFIYGPLLDDRMRTVADGVKPSEYGRRQAFEVHRALKEKGPVDGAARVRVHGPGRGRARRRLPAPQAPSSTIHRLFEAEIERFSLEDLARAAGGRRSGRPGLQLAFVTRLRSRRIGWP